MKKYHYHNSLLSPDVYILLVDPRAHLACGLMYSKAVAVLLFQVQVLLVKDGDANKYIKFIYTVLYVATSESIEEVNYTLHFRKSIKHTCSILK